MPARHRVALALCLLALAAPALAYRELQQTCRTQRVDKYFKFVVESKICNWWKPGQNTTYGGATFGVLPFFPAECIVANNSFPGPTIKVNKGDWVQVDVQSRLTGREITIHWHGLKQEGTPWADGASMINSCPINPGQTQTYLFHADDPGLYFWHGHGGLEEEYGLSGALEIVDPDDPYEQNNLYDEELEKHVETRDWWMAPDAHAAQAHTMRFYQQLWPHGVPLVNGFYGNGTANLPYYSMNLTANTCYRTKFICANTQWPGWFISINDQNNQPVNMTMITLTGENLQPLNTHRFAYYIAQRAEAVVCTGAPGVTWRMLVNSSQPEDGYCRDGPQSAANAFGNLSVPGCINHMTVELNIIPEGANPRPKRANRALLQTYPFVQTFDSLVHPEQVVPWEPVNVPQNPTQTWNIFVGVSPGGGGEGNMYAWEERDYGLAMPSAPPLFTRGGRCGTADPPRPGQIPIRGVTDKAWLQKTVRYGEVVDIIFNNLSPFYHPMHLHGYDFTVLASRYYVDAGYTIQPQHICPTGFRWVVPSWDSITTGPPWPRQAPLGGGFAAFAFGCPYNATENNTRWDLPNPYLTDIVPVPAHGWTKVRVRFNNPGSWFLHCHLAVHMIRGMGFMVNAAIDRVPRIPSWVDTSCVGSCRVQGQICGDYAPPRSQISQCSAAQDVCVPRGLSSMMSGK